MNESENYYINLSPEKLREEFDQLRRRVLEQTERETKERIRNNPQPTEQEIFMGAFREEIEPQIRDAVDELYKKGYTTGSSGFHGSASEQQILYIKGEVDNQTKTALESIGNIKVFPEKLPIFLEDQPRRRKVTLIKFMAPVPELKNIKAMWDTIADIFPPKEVPDQLLEEKRRRHREIINETIRKFSQG